MYLHQNLRKVKVNTKRISISARKETLKNIKNKVDKELWFGLFNPSTVVCWGIFLIRLDFLKNNC